MTTPTFTLRIAFASSPFASSPTWTTIASGHLMSWTRRKGRQYELNRLEAGTLDFKLLNTSGYYWVDNASGPYYGNILPWKRVNLRATYNSVTYDLYTGFIKSWDPDFILKPIKGPVINVSCADLIRSLSKLPLDDATGYSEELSGTRVGNVLDDLGWPAADRTIDTGQSTLQATGALSNQIAMSHLFSVQDTELGAFFIAGDGKAVFQDRHARLKSPYTVSQGTFGDTPASGELPYTEIKPSFDDERIYNYVRVTRLSGSEQVSSDSTSITAYGKRNLDRPSLLMATDAEALAQADYLKAKYKDPVQRTKSIRIKAGHTSYESSLYPLVLGLDISSRITVKLSGGSINKDFHIEGIQQSWDATKPNELDTLWQLNDATPESYWILGDSTYGVLGDTTKLAY